MKRWRNIKSYNNLRELSEQDLRDYIRDRLRFPEGSSPSIIMSRDEEPEDFVINTFAVQGVASTFIVQGVTLEKFYKAVTDLLCEQWNIIEQQDSIEGEYLSRILYLVEYFRISMAEHIVFSLASNSKYLMNLPGYYTDKVYEHALRTLASVQGRATGYIEFFRAKLKDPEMEDFVQAIFTGIRFCGLEHALDALPDYARIVSQRKELLIKLSISLVSLIGQYGNPDEIIIQKIVRAMSGCPAGQKKVVFDALCLSPLISKREDFMKIIDTLK